MVDVFREEPISFAQAPTILPGRPSFQSLHRWATKGRRGVRLESVLIGGRRYTTREAFFRFVERLTAIADGEAATELTISRSSRQRRADHDRATAQLENLKI
jgi:hypothetical protein